MSTPEQNKPTTPADNQAMPNQTTPNQATPNQTTRRIAYGLNVAVAVVLAVVLLGLVNWLGATRSIPVDLPFTRHYRLSEQSRSLLDSLKQDYTIVTLFSPASGAGPGSQTQQAIDLADQYARLSPRISVEHIISGLNTGRETALFETIKKRYAPELEPINQAVQESIAQVRALEAESKSLLPLLTQGLEALGESDAKAKADLTQYIQVFSRMGPQFDEMIQGFDRLQNAPLPDSSRVLEALRNALTQTSTNLYARVVVRLDALVKDDKTPAAARDALAQALAIVRRTQTSLDQTINRIRSVPLSEGYSNLVQQLSQPNTVLVLGPTKERVISLASMFRDLSPDPDNAPSQAEQVERGFLGEELLTGALVSLEQKQMPLVVFVYAGRVPPFGRPQQASQEYMKYNVVADRLRKMDFEVADWSPMPRMGPMGQQTPPGPAPEPKEGQKAVWIFVPVNEDDPMMMTMMGPQALTKIQDLFVERMSKGESAMAILQMSPGSRFNSNPMLQAIESWGIKPELDKLILKQITGPDRKVESVPVHEITQWPQDLSITRAMSGMATVFVQPSPLVISPPKNADVKVSPLVWITGRENWTESDLTTGIGRMKFNPETASDKFTVAAAGETKNNRLIVVADPFWASDAVSNLGLMGPGSAELTGARYPGDQELFINSVFWLAHMDQLIAASPRTQDIRRVQEIPQARLTLIQWALILGMPGFTLLLGVAVYVVRRQG